MLPILSSPARDLLLLAVGLLTGAATIAGGAVALRLKSSSAHLMAFSCGAVIGVALFDLLPEALVIGRQHHAAPAITTAMAGGFFAYFLVDRVSQTLGRGNTNYLAHFAPASLSAHSLMDGLGIGLAFHASPTAGIVVAIAVLTHDFLDGVNTVTLSMSGGGGRATARAWLLADAVAPLAGIGASQLLIVPEGDLAIALALFAGFFLYIGASELFRRRQERRHPTSTLFATLGGLGLIYAVVTIAGA